MNDETEVDFPLLDRQLNSLLGDEPDPLANTANFVGLLYDALPAVNWLGIYVLRGEELVLGPFQGKPACVRLPLDEGVCAEAARTCRTVRVENVHEFAGHIACDPASRSELVVPLVVHGELVGVLDIDSPRIGRFSVRDQEGVELLCRTFTSALAVKTKRGNAFI